MVATLEIFCDFDGTITRADSVDILLEHLANPLWRAIEERWERGEIGSRQCMGEQIALIAGGWPAVERALDDLVEVDPSFSGFVAWCRAQGIKVNVVSDGLDRAIRHVLDREGISVDSIVANRLVETAEGSLALEFPHGSKRRQCASGVCKCEILEKVSLRTYRVFVGDGRSDFCCADKAHYLFAKSKLFRFCCQNGLDCLPFENFDDVLAELERTIVVQEDGGIFAYPKVYQGACVEVNR